MKKFSSIMRASSRRTSRNKFFVRVLVTGVILIMLAFLVPRTVSFVASLILTPILSVERWFTESSASLPSYIRDRAEILAQQESLEKELSAQSGTELTLQRLQSENISLRSLLGASTTERIAAGVIAKPTVVPYDVLVIDKGGDEGVVLDAPVFTGHDQVIGFVAEVFSGSAVVTLVTTPGYVSTVYVIGPDIYTTAVGQGGGVLQIGVPQGVPMAINDLVVLPSLDAGVYGQIVSIDTLDSRPEQYGYVTIDEPMQSIRWVSVGTDSLKPLSFEAAREVVDGVKADLLSVPVPAGVLVEIPTEATSSASTTQPEAVIEEG